jgi:hypothetical protein
MNTFRTLLLITVFIVQISGLPGRSNSESLGFCNYSEKVSEGVKPETSTKSTLESKELHTTLKREEVGYLNNPISRKEVILKSVQPTLIKKRRENPPVNAAPSENKQPSRKVSIGVYIRSIGTGNAELL